MADYDLYEHQLNPIGKFQKQEVLDSETDCRNQKRSGNGYDACENRLRPLGASSHRDPRMDVESGPARLAPVFQTLRTPDTYYGIREKQMNCRLTRYFSNSNTEWRVLSLWQGLACI